MTLCAHKPKASKTKRTQRAAGSSPHESNPKAEKSIERAIASTAPEQLKPAAVATSSPIAPDVLEPQASETTPSQPAESISQYSLMKFVTEAWPVLEPATELQWNWHLDVICE